MKAELWPSLQIVTIIANCLCKKVPSPKIGDDRRLSAWSFVPIANQLGESEVVDGVVYYKDKFLMQRWHCSAMKLWRMRKDGKLNSIQLGGCGPYLTSDAEIARIEAPPENASAANSCSTRSDGGAIDTSAGRQSNPTNKPIESFPQVPSNGGAA